MICYKLKKGGIVMRILLLDELLKLPFVKDYHVDNINELAWVETTKICADGKPLVFLIDFDEKKDVFAVVKMFKIPMSDNFFSKTAIISLFLQNQLNIFLLEKAAQGAFNISFDFGKKETIFEGSLTYCFNVKKCLDLPMLVKTIEDSMQTIISIIDDIDKFIDKARNYPEKLDFLDAIFIDKLTNISDVEKAEFIERTMIFTLHPALKNFLSGMYDENDKE